MHTAQGCLCRQPLANVAVCCASMGAFSSNSPTGVYCPQVNLNAMRCGAGRASACEAGTYRVAVIAGGCGRRGWVVLSQADPLSGLELTVRFTTYGTKLAALGR